MKKSQLHGHITSSMIERLIKHNQPGPAALTRHLAAASSAVLGLEAIAKNKNPMETDAAHARRVADGARKLANKVSQIENDIAETNTRQRARLESEIAQKANLIPSANAAEIRASLRAMPEKDRSKIIIDAMRGSDSGAEILAAVAGGNLVTTGLSDEQRTLYISEFKKMRAPDLYAELESISEIMDHTPQILGIAKTAATEAVDPGYLESINQAEKAAVEANEAFNNSIL